MAMTTVAVHMLGVFWLGLLCPFMVGTAVYAFLEAHLLCYEGQAYEAAMLFGLMWGAFLGLVIFGLAVYATFKYRREGDGHFR